jgi:histidyl-tRNA synthetase
MKLVRGTKDWINSDVDIYNHLISILKKNAHLHGFSEIFVPILEDLSLFSRAVGEDTDIVSKEMYFAVNKNQLDKNSLDKTKDESDKTVLRPEATSSVVRFLGSNGLLQSMPQKLYTYGPMFRYERPQKGRLRQLHQFSLECFGLAEPTADADVIKYAQKVLHEIGLHDVELEINSIGDDESRFAYKKALVDYLSKYKNDLSEDSQRRLITNPLRILDTKNEKDQEILLTAPKLSDYLNDHSKRFFDSVLLLLSKIGVEYAINEKLVRGLDYYNHTVFEFKLDSFGAQSTLIGGGRYDGLVAKMFGPDKNIPAIGWGMGLDRVVMILKEAGLGNIENRNKKIAILMWNDDITSDEGDINTLDSYRAFGMTLAEKVRKFYIGAEVIFGKKIGDCLKKAINMNFDYDNLNFG